MQTLFYIVLDSACRKYSEALKIVEQPLSKREPSHRIGGSFLTRREAEAYRAGEYERSAGG